MEVQYKYMVEVFLSDVIDDDYTDLIEAQREHVSDLFNVGKLISYTLAEDRSRLWAVILANSESELVSIIDGMPLSPYVEYDYCPLLFHESIHLIPSMSLN